ncbi:MAG: hypothetical protein LAE24_07485 [Candidatus Contendobacter sp.]|nr:hypothetical protein [Candidatus Contendobacter sp.]
MPVALLLTTRRFAGSLFLGFLYNMDFIQIAGKVDGLLKFIFDVLIECLPDFISGIFWDEPTGIWSWLQWLKAIGFWFIVLIIFIDSLLTWKIKNRRR